MLAGANAADVSDRAVERGLGQIGSLGSGNHFLEVQAVDSIYDASAAAHLGLEEGTVCVMIHTGSRGLGHQICTDHVRVIGNAMGRYGIHVPDRQLACVPVRSPEGQAYLAAMAAAANYGRANRQCLTEATRRVFEQHTPTTSDLLYDVSHNLAKIEVHDERPRPTPLGVVVRTAKERHARCRPPTMPSTCRPTLRPSANRCSYPARWGTAAPYAPAGVSDNPASFSTAHGAGRVQSRHQAASAAPAVIRCADTWRPPASWCAAVPRGGSPRRNPRPTRTSTPS